MNRCISATRAGKDGNELKELYTDWTCSQCRKCGSLIEMNELQGRVKLRNNLKEQNRGKLSMPVERYEAFFCR